MIENKFHLTNPFIKETSQAFRDDLLAKLKVVCPLFPELTADRLEVGITTYYVACACTPMKDRIKIKLNPKQQVSYFTLGHELTHFVQDISNVPHGEKQCDIWTIARNKIFLDEPPTNLYIPSETNREWDMYSEAIRELCINAIEIRKSKRHYIKWLEQEIKQLQKEK